MSPEQCRAARAWLGWSQAALAAEAQVSTSTIRNFEAEARVPHPNNLRAMQKALEQAGMRFAADGSGLSVVAKKKGRS